MVSLLTLSVISISFSTLYNKLQGASPGLIRTGDWERVYAPSWAITFFPENREGQSSFFFCHVLDQ